MEEVVVVAEPQPLVAVAAVELRPEEEVGVVEPHRLQVPRELRGLPREWPPVVWRLRLPHQKHGMALEKLVHREEEVVEVGLRRQQVRVAQELLGMVAREQGLLQQALPREWPLVLV